MTGPEHEQYEADVERAARSLLANIQAAVNALDHVGRSITELERLYDVEFCEGHEGLDAQREHDTAAAAVRNLQRIAQLRIALFHQATPPAVES